MLHTCAVLVVGVVKEALTQNVVLHVHDNAFSKSNDYGLFMCTFNKYLYTRHTLTRKNVAIIIRSTIYNNANKLYNPCLSSSVLFPQKIYVILCICFKKD